LPEISVKNILRKAEPFSKPVSSRCRKKPRH
jgi:hypothetical protein